MYDFGVNSLIVSGFIFTLPCVHMGTDLVTTYMHMSTDYIHAHGYRLHTCTWVQTAYMHMGTDCIHAHGYRLHTCTWVQTACMYSTLQINHSVGTHTFVAIDTTIILVF